MSIPTSMSSIELERTKRRFVTISTEYDGTEKAVPAFIPVSVGESVANRIERDRSIIRAFFRSSEGVGSIDIDPRDRLEVSIIVST